MSATFQSDVSCQFEPKLSLSLFTFLSSRLSSAAVCSYYMQLK